jgi:hypothetical protein
VRETAPLYRAVLVDVNTVTALWSLPPATVLAMIECGQIRWAWDVSVHHGPRREIRVWLRELFDPLAARILSARGVVESVIGHATEPRLRATTLRRMIMVPPMTIHRLVEVESLRGDVAGGVLWITRASLVEFLTQRLIL